MQLSRKSSYKHSFAVNESLILSNVIRAELSTSQVLSPLMKISDDHLTFPMEIYGNFCLNAETKKISLHLEFVNKTSFPLSNISIAILSNSFGLIMETPPIELLNLSKEERHCEDIAVIVNDGRVTTHTPPTAPEVFNEINGICFYNKTNRFMFRLTLPIKFAFESPEKCPAYYESLRTENPADQFEVKGMSNSTEFLTNGLVGVGMILVNKTEHAMGAVMQFYGKIVSGTEFAVDVKIPPVGNAIVRLSCSNEHVRNSIKHFLIEFANIHDENI